MKKYTLEFFKDYKAEYKEKEDGLKRPTKIIDFLNIIHLYFKYTTAELVKGEPLSLFHLANVKIVRKFRMNSKPTVLSGKTHRLRKATGDNTLTVYRENEDYFCPMWTGKLQFPNIRFKGTTKMKRSLEPNRDLLELTAETATFVYNPKTKKDVTSS